MRVYDDAPGTSAIVHTSRIGRSPCWQPATKGPAACATTTPGSSTNPRAGGQRFHDYRVDALAMLMRRTSAVLEPARAVALVACHPLVGLHDAATWMFTMRRSQRSRCRDFRTRSWPDSLSFDTEGKNHRVDDGAAVRAERPSIHLNPPHSRQKQQNRCNDVRCR